MGYTKRGIYFRINGKFLFSIKIYISKIFRLRIFSVLFSSIVSKNTFVVKIRDGQDSHFDL